MNLSFLKPFSGTGTRPLRRSAWALIGLGAFVCVACVVFLEWQWGRVMAGEERIVRFHQRSELLAGNAVRELYRMQQPGSEPERDGVLPYSRHTGMFQVGEALRHMREIQKRYGGWITGQALARAEEAYRLLKDTREGETADTGASMEMLRIRLVQLERLHASKMAALSDELERERARHPRWLALFLVLVPGAGLLVAWRILSLITHTVNRQADSEAALAEAQQIAGLGKWEWFPHARTFSGSGQTWEILGLPHSGAPVNDRLHDERIHPEDRSRVREAAAAALAGLHPYAIQYRVTHPDGSVRWVYGCAEVERSPSGIPVRMVGTLLDVTALKESEMRLAENRALLLAINASQSRYIEDGDPSSMFNQLLEDLLHLTDSAYGFIAEAETGPDGAPLMRSRAISDVTWNAETRHMFEEAGENGLVFSNMDTLFGAVVRTREVVLSNAPQDDSRAGGLPEGHPPLNAFLGMPLFSSGELVGMVGIANRPDGYRLEQVAFLEPFLSSCGNLIHVIREHRLRQEAEEALRESEARFRALAENINEVFWVSTPDSARMVYVSPAFEDIFQQSVTELYQDRRAFLAHVHPEDRERVAAAMAGLHRSIDEVFRVARPDGGMRWVQARSFPVISDAGELLQVVGIAIDITAAREAETAERRHQEELTRVARLTTLGEVASGIAHELNQPLFAITNYARGSVRRLDSGASAGELHATLEKIAVQAERASEVIDHLRDLSRGEGIRRQAEQINDVVRTAVRLAAADGQGIPVKLSLADPLPPVAADRVQLEQVVINLIRNGMEAVGGDPSGRITVSTTHNGNGHLSVTVTDTGSGIAEEARAELFEPFFTTKSGGMGMGLAICRTIVQAHQGEIWGRNSEHGTEFGFSLPVLETEE